MKAAARLAAVLALGIAIAAGAQESADKTRLDDFALPQDQAAPRIEQLGDGAESLPPEPAAVSDRELAIPGSTQADRAPVAQLSQSGETAPAQQVGDRQESRQLAAGSVSTPGDSRPEASAPLAGNDSCDPQLDTEQRERCLRILERRAAEFDAPEAPQLTAEQALLAQTGDVEELLASPSSELRLRLASDDPDPELASNQELASIYLDRGQAQQSPGAADEPVEDGDATLEEVLQGLQIDMAGSGQ